MTIQLIDDNGNASPVHWLGEDGDGNRIAYVPEGYSLAGADYWFDDSGYAHVSDGSAEGSATEGAADDTDSR